MKLKALDLFCGAGGVSVGLERAGFEVTGVDIARQSTHPLRFKFIQADALDILRDRAFVRQFHFIWASPPCQGYSALRHAPGAKVHPKLIAPVRKLLYEAARPFCIENVEAAAPYMKHPVTLCGSMFGLGATVKGARYELRRHRLFECWPFTVALPRPCEHGDRVVGVYGGHARCRSSANGGRGTRDFIGSDQKRIASAAMGIDWMTLKGLSQAIPPAYAEHIGLTARAHVLSFRR